MAAELPVHDNPCKKSRKCSKPAGHTGRCNTQKQINSFWESSVVFQQNERKRKLDLKECDLDERQCCILDEEEEIKNNLAAKGNQIRYSHAATFYFGMDTLSCMQKIYNKPV